MKLLRGIFSRFTLIALAIVLQVVANFLLLTYVAKKYSYILIAFQVIAVLLIIFLLTRENSPSYKIPWIIILLCLPIFGIVVFFTFGIPTVRKQIKKRFIKASNETEKYLLQDNKVIADLNKKHSDVASQVEYLRRTSKTPLDNNTYTKYFSSGKEYYKMLLETLKRAKKYIFIETFIIGYGEMWKGILEILKDKKASGIEVFLIYDDIGSMPTLSNNFAKEMRKLGFNCIKFNPFVPFVSSVYNYRDHRKITIVDGIYAFTGGINIADEYIDVTHPYGKWKDSGIYLEGKGARSLTMLFLQMYNSNAKEEIDIEKYIVKEEDYPKKSNGYVLAYGDGPYPVYRDHIGEETYFNVITNAKKYLYITTPYLIVDYHLMVALKVASKRGVDVRIITPHVPDKKAIYYLTKNSYESLIEDGVKIYEYTPGFIHAKNFVCDDEVGIVGTINLDYRSLVHHFECATWMCGTSSVKDIKDDFLATLNVCMPMTKENCKLKWYQKIIRNAIILFAPLF